MIFLEIAIFILLITLAFYLSEKIMWLIYYLFNFRVWDVVVEKMEVNFILEMAPLAKFFTLTILAIATYLIMYMILMKIGFEPIKYIVLAILMVIVFKNFTLSEIFFFKDYIDSDLKMVDSIGLTKDGDETGFSKEKFVEFWVSVLNWLINIFVAIFNGVMKILNGFW